MVVKLNSRLKNQLSNQTGVSKIQKISITHICEEKSMTKIWKTLLLYSSENFSWVVNKIFQQNEKYEKKLAWIQMFST